MEAQCTEDAIFGSPTSSRDEPWMQVRDQLIKEASANSSVARYGDLITDEAMCTRFVKGCKGYVSKSVEMFKAHLEWRVDYQLDTIVDEHFPDLEAPNELYWAGRDKDGVMTLMWRLQHHDARRTDAKRFVRFFVHQIEKGLRTCVSYPNAHFNIGVDLANVGYANIDQEMGIILQSVLTKNYPKVRKGLYVFPINWFVNLLWDSLLKPLLSTLQPDIEDKICPLTGDWKAKLLERYDIAEIETRLGGQLDLQARPAPVVMPYHPTPYTAFLEHAETEIGCGALPEEDLLGEEVQGSAGEVYEEGAVDGEEERRWGVDSDVRIRGGGGARCAVGAEEEEQEEENAVEVKQEVNLARIVAGEGPAVDTEDEMRKRGVGGIVEQEGVEVLEVRRGRADEEANELVPTSWVESLQVAHARFEPGPSLITEGLPLELRVGSVGGAGDANVDSHAGRRGGGASPGARARIPVTEEVVTSLDGDSLDESATEEFVTPPTTPLLQPRHGLGVAERGRRPALALEEEGEKERRALRSAADAEWGSLVVVGELLQAVAGSGEASAGMVQACAGEEREGVGDEVEGGVEGSEVYGGGGQAMGCAGSVPHGKAVGLVEGANGVVEEAAGVVQRAVRCFRARRACDEALAWRVFELDRQAVVRAVFGGGCGEEGEGGAGRVGGDSFVDVTSGREEEQRVWEQGAVDMLSRTSAAAHEREDVVVCSKPPVVVEESGDPHWRRRRGELLV